VQGDRLRIVGVGTQDGLGPAKQFVARHKLKLQQMYWDKSGASWRYWGVPGQPAGLLVSAKGEVVQAWAGAIDRDAIITYLDANAPKKK
jgi:hypothetical protein